MTPRVRFGLIAGGVGLLLNICVSAAMGICGPVTSLVAGAAAGFFAAQGENPATQGDGARVGAISGVIAGALVFLGQLIGGLAIIMIFPSLGVPPPIGTLPDPADPASFVPYYIGGVGVSLCFGLVGLAVAAGAGALAGFLATPSQAARAR